MLSPFVAVEIKTLGSVGRTVQVQLGLSVVVKLQPSLDNGRGRVMEGGEG